MWHNRAYRKLGRKHSHRVATLRALATALFERERIQTTLMKAKELRPFAEKLITRARRDDLHSRRLVLRHLQDRRVVKKLFESLAPRYAERNGGYSRILRLGIRPGDGAEMALVELIGSEPVFKKEAPAAGVKKKAAARPGKAKEAAPSPEASHEPAKDTGPGKTARRGTSSRKGMKKTP